MEARATILNNLFGDNTKIIVFEDTAAVTLRDLKEEIGWGGHGEGERYCSEIFRSLLLAVLRC